MNRTINSYLSCFFFFIPVIAFSILTDKGYINKVSNKDECAGSAIRVNLEKLRSVKKLL